MDTFNERAQGFEAKKARQDEAHFKNKAEAVRRVGYWVGQMLGFDEQTTRDYRQNLVQNFLVTGGIKAVVEEVYENLIEHSHRQDKDLIEHKLRGYLAELDAEDNIT